MQNICSIDIGYNNLSIVTAIFNNNHKINNISDINSLLINGTYLINICNSDDNDEKICEAIVQSGKNKGCKCSSKCIIGQLTCKRHMDKDMKKKINIPKKINKKQKEIYKNKQSFCEKIIFALDKIIEPQKFNLIILERQPPKNKIMNEISHYLFMYLISKLPKFNVQNNIEKKNNIDKTKIIYLNAKKRMSSLCTMYINGGSPNKFFKNDTYYHRKKNAVALVNLLNLKYDNDVKKMEQYKKKDDISDSILQIIFYKMLYK
jgi:hypothetical protein